MTKTPLNTLIHQIKKSIDSGNLGHSTTQKCIKLFKKKPKNTQVLLQYGRLLYVQGKLTQAINILKRGLALQPENSELRFLLFASYKDSYHHGDMLKLCHSFATSPNINEQSLAYAAYLDICAWDQARKVEQHIIDATIAGKIDQKLIPGLLLTSNGRPHISREQQYLMHRKWGEDRPPRHNFNNSPPIKGKIRIAYVSADFCCHPVGLFMSQIILSHHRDYFEIFCYAELVKKDDQFRQLFQNNADHYIDISEMNDVALVKQMRKDNIHIAIDLSGHTIHSRTQAFGFRLAPVQISYLGYPNTSGIEAMDFHITDHFAEDLEQGTKFTEKLLFMPKSFLLYGVSMSNSKNDTAPCEKSGIVTFGSFNNSRKLNLEVIRVWSTILKRVHQSHLHIKFSGSGSTETQKNIHHAFKKYGIEEDRIIILETTVTISEHIQAYHDIDIALDTFPYTGTTTTCEALSQGVPVVTLVGAKHANRVSYSILKNIGFVESIVYSTEEYVEKAVGLAQNPHRLSILRKCLPTLLQHSPLRNSDEFINDLESLYREAWKIKVGTPIINKKETTTMTMAGDISVVVEKSLNSITPYVLTEQGDWYEDEIRFLRRIVTPGMRILDLQAGYGCYALSLAKLTGDTGIVLAISSCSEETRCIGESAQLNNIHCLTTSTDLQSAAPFIREGIDILIAETPESFAPEFIAQINGSPLIMLHPTEVLADTAALLEQMQSQGFTPYRFIPGLNLLAPHAESIAPEKTAQPIFFCQQDRADALAESNHLAQQIAPSLNLPDDLDYWQKAIEPCAFASELLELWKELVTAQQTSNDWESARNALAAYAMAHDTSNTPNERFGFLRAAFSLLLNSPELQSSLPRLCTAARIATELGNPEAALQALGMIKEGITTTQTFVASEPFLPVAKRYDQTNFNDALAEWILAQAITQIELLQHPTSFYSRFTLEETLVTVGKLGVADELIIQRITAVKSLILDQEESKLAFDPDNPKQWSDQVLQCHEKWQQFPDDDAIIDQIRQLRISFANYCLSSSNTTDFLYTLRNGVQEGIRTLMNGNIRYEPLSNEEQSIVDTILNSDIKNENILITGIFYLLPHAIPQHPDIIKLSDTILNIYLDFMLLPVNLFREVGEVDLYSKHMHEWVSYLHLNITELGKGRWPAPSQKWQKIAEHFFNKANFISMYQTSGSLKSILIQRAEIMEKVLMDKCNLSLNYKFTKPLATRKRIRLGILAAHYTPQTETYVMLTYYRYLDRSQFEIILFSTTKTNHPLEQQCKKHADKFILLEGSCDQMANQMRRWDLDILLLGTNVSAVTHTITALALFQLARIQVTPNISVLTTGMRHWDFFIDTATHNNEFAQYNCTEKMESLGLRKTQLNTGNLHLEVTSSYSRDILGISDDAIVYVSSCSVFKITPELQRSWAKIITSVPNSYLILCPFNPNWTNQHPVKHFINGIAKTFQEHCIENNRLMILPTYGAGNVRNLLQLADVFLDSYVAAAGVTVPDILSAGIVPVMIDGNTLRTQTAASTLGKPYFKELFAKNNSEYERIAVNLALNPVQLNDLKKRILQREESEQSTDNHTDFGIAVNDCLKRIWMQNCQRCFQP